MNIMVNNQLKSVTPSHTILKLVNDAIGEKQKGIAIAVNNTVVPKSDWPSFLLHEKDDVLIIKATQGG